MKTFNEILNAAGKSTDNIIKIYRGKDNYCRCGCGGKYFYPGDRGFTRALNQLSNQEWLENNTDEKDILDFGNGINFPYDYSTHEGKALTVYFD